jgi:co-chaperonin GroES (HSP10)
VLLRPKATEEVTDWGFKLDVGNDFKREKAATDMGTVLEVGPTAWNAFDKWKPNGDLNPEWKPWAVPGDTVVFAKYGGKFVEVDGEEYVLINDEDVQCVVRENSSE